MRNLLRSTFSLALLLCCVALYANAQQIGIDSRVQSFITVGFDPSVAEAEVSFTENLVNSAENFSPSNVTLRLDDGRVIRAISAGLAPGSFRRVIVNFDVREITEDNASFQLCFARLRFQDSAGANQVRTEPLCTTLDLTNPGNIEARLATALEKLKEVPKTSKERNIFASGFTSTSDSEETEGGADINLNPGFGIPDLTAVLRLKKSTAEGADPKHFTLGANYRSFYLFGGKSRRQIRNILAQPTLSALDGQTVNNLIEKEQGRFFSGIQFDFAGSLEGEALKFSVTNAVADGSLQFVSPTKTIFGSRKASVSYRLMPLGIEAGHNLGKGEDALASADPAQARFRLFSRAAVFLDECARRLSLLSDVAAAKLKSARYIAGWAAWRDGGVRLAPTGNYEAALSRLAEASRLFVLLGEEEHVVGVEAERACIALVAELEAIRQSGDVAEVEARLRHSPMFWHSCFLAYRALFVLAAEGDENIRAIIAHYARAIAVGAAQVRDKALFVLRDGADRDLSEALLIFDCGARAWMNVLVDSPTPPDEVWKVYKKTHAKLIPAEATYSKRRVLARIIYSLASRSARRAITRLAAAVDSCADIESFEIHLLIELCSASIYGSAFARAKDFPAEESARIYMYVAQQTADISQKSSYYATASNLWQAAGQQGKALLYRAISGITAPSQGADHHILDDLRSALTLLPPNSPERRLCEDNIWAINVQMLIQMSRNALAKNDGETALAVAEAALREAEVRTANHYPATELLERAKSWNDVARAAILFASTEEQEANLTQSEIRRRYHKVYRLLRGQGNSFVSEFVELIKRRAEGEFYYHAGFKIFNEAITYDKGSRLLRYAKYFLKSGGCFEGTHHENNSFTHAYQLMASYHQICGIKSMATRSYRVSEYHLAQALRLYSEAYSRRTDDASPQTVLYRYRLMELRSFQNEVYFEQTKTPQYLLLTAHFAKLALDVLQENSETLKLLDLAEVKYRYQRLAEACNALGISSAI